MHIWQTDAIEEMDLLETEDTMLVLHESENEDAENDDQDPKVEIKVGR